MNAGYLPKGVIHTGIYWLLIPFLSTGRQQLGTSGRVNAFGDLPIEYKKM
jgi:hypothetical protein